MGDQMYSAAMVGKGSVNMTVKAMGMEIDMKGVIEARQNGKAVIMTMSMNGMEMMKGEIEKINEATLTGKFDTENKVEVNLESVKVLRGQLIKDLRKDVALNYKPILIKKLQKVAPDMLSIFAKTKNLVKQVAPTVINKVKPKLQLVLQK